MTTSDRAAELLKLDFFGVLGVPRTADSEAVKKGYFAAVKTFHPDRAGSDEQRAAYTKAFARIELAKATLMDPARRQRYLDELSAGGAQDRSAAEASLEFAKAEAYLKTNARARAEEHARRAVTLAPNNDDYAVLLITIEATPDAKPERVAELVAQLDAILVRQPNSERALLQRGQLRKRLGRTHEAMADMARVTELNPSNIEAARELRLHKMRSVEKKPEPEPESKGFGAAFRRLFKRDS